MAKCSSHKSLCRKLNLVGQGEIGLDSGQGSTPLNKVTGWVVSMSNDQTQLTQKSV